MISKDIFVIARDTGSTGPSPQSPRKPEDRRQGLWDPRDEKQGKMCPGQGGRARRGDTKRRSVGLGKQVKACKFKSGGNVGGPVSLVRGPGIYACTPEA